MMKDISCIPFKSKYIISLDMYELDKYIWSFNVIYHSMLGFYCFICDN